MSLTTRANEGLILLRECESTHGVIAEKCDINNIERGKDEIERGKHGMERRKNTQ